MSSLMTAGRTNAPLLRFLENIKLYVGHVGSISYGGIFFIETNCADVH